MDSRVYGSCPALLMSPPDRSRASHGCVNFYTAAFKFRMRIFDFRIQAPRSFVAKGALVLMEVRHRLTTFSERSFKSLPCGNKSITPLVRVATRRKNYDQ